MSGAHLNSHSQDSTVFFRRNGTFFERNIISRLVKWKTPDLLSLIFRRNIAFVDSSVSAEKNGVSPRKILKIGCTQFYFEPKRTQKYLLLCVRRYFSIYSNPKTPKPHHLKIFSHKPISQIIKIQSITFLMA